MSRQLRGRDAVAQAGGAARDFGEARELDPVSCSRLCVVVEELVANLYDHGGLGVEDCVDLTFDCESGGVRIVIVDRGRPFDPRSSPRTRKRPRRGGGAGIDIVRAWARIVDYSVGEQGNQLTLVLPVEGL